MIRTYLLILVIGLGTMLAGCASAPAAVPTAALPASTQASQSAAKPTVIQAPATAVATAAAAGATSAPASAATAASRWVLDAASSEARFKAREKLAGHDLSSDAIGATKTLKGVIVIDKQGVVLGDQSKFEVDLNSLKSDESRRDSFIKSNTLQTSKFPSAMFVPTATKDLPSPVPDSGEGQFQIIGDMTIHGVTKPLTWDVTAKKAGNQLTGRASTVITLADFGMTSPKVPLVLSIEDKITLEIDFTLAQEN